MTGSFAFVTPLGGGPVPRAFFEPDQLLPSQWRAIFNGSMEALPAHARLFRAIIDSALHDLGYPADHLFHQRAVAWIRDHHGRYAAFDCTFAEAVEYGYVGLDPDILSLALLRRLAVQGAGRHFYYLARSTHGRLGGPQRVGQKGPVPCA